MQRQSRPKLLGCWGGEVAWNVGEHFCTVREKLDRKTAEDRTAKKRSAKGRSAMSRSAEKRQFGRVVPGVFCADVAKLPQSGFFGNNPAR